METTLIAAVQAGTVRELEVAFYRSLIVVITAQTVINVIIANQDTVSLKIHASLIYHTVYHRMAQSV